jgi:transcriptional regulator with XRE-family HTH domain
MKIDPKLLEAVRRLAIGNLKELREERGLTVFQVCKACHMSPRTLQNVESGKGNPRVLTLLKLYKFYFREDQ